jgi:hypothetical protein
MINVKFDTVEFQRTMRNSIAYSNGFVSGVNSNKLFFNRVLAEYALQALNKFIDAKARMSPDSLHHVYEWNMVGVPSARLFDIQANATTASISFTGSFTSSSSISDSSNEPFEDKARIMENSIDIVVEPRFSDALAFEGQDGEAVFTVGSIYIENPGGDAVAGSFGRVVGEFFDVYFTSTFLSQSGILSKLSRATEFAQFFPSGAKGGGASTGTNAAKKYLSIKGLEIS